MGNKTAEPGRLTQKQLADKLGLSAATVSLALRDSPMIAEETRRLVHDAIRRYGYVYNVAAASLRTGRTGIVGVSFHDIVNPFFAEMLASLDDAFSAAGMALFINNHGDEPARLARFVENLRAHGADGLIVSPSLGTDAAMLEPLTRAGASVVFVMRTVPGFPADFAGASDANGMGLAVRHLLALGHREIVMLGGMVGTSTADNRLAGFRRALIGHGLPWRDELHLPGSAKRVVGAQLARQALRLRPRPSAFACFNDLIAFGAINALRLEGLTPGRDIAVTGHDDTEEARISYPPLTTVSNYPARIGAEAARLLLDRLRDPGAPVQHFTTEPSLVVRESCGSAPAESVQ